MNFTNLINKIENRPVSFSHWLVAFLGIIFIRFFWENLSNHTTSGIIAADFYTLLHYYLFYLGLILSLALVVYLITKVALLKIFRVLLFGLPLLWLAPILDLLFSKGKGIAMAYLFQLPSQWLNSFFTYFGPLFEPGITIGIRIEVLVILFFLFLYAQINTRNTFKSIVVTLLSYALIFLWVSFPSFIYWLQYLAGAVLPDSVIYFFVNNIYLSNLSQNIILPYSSISYWRDFEVLFNVAISQIYYLLIFVLVIIVLAVLDKNKLFILLKNSRPYRLLHYWLMIVAGMILAGHINSYFGFSFIDGISLMVLFVSWYCAWMFSVGTNDIVDFQIDRISNTSRPLPSGEFTLREYKNFNLFFLLGAILGGYLLGYYSFFLILVFIFSYYIYSCPPLRFKKILFLSTFLIALATAASILTGFFLVSSNKSIGFFPIRLLLAIIISFTLAANIKDLKDWDGDSQGGVRTILVVWGKDRGRKIIAYLLAASIMLFPILAGQFQYLFLSFIFSLLGYYLVQRQVNEKYLFILYFCYLVLIMFFDYLV